MIYTTLNTEFHKFASTLDTEYLAFDNAGYDLCSLEAVHTLPTLEGGYIYTLLFSENSEALSVHVGKGKGVLDCFVAALNK